LSRRKDTPSPKSDSLLVFGDPLFENPDDAKDADKPDEPASSLPPGGLLATRIVPGGGGAKAGLKPGDVLLRYGAVAIDNMQTLTKAIADSAATKGTERDAPVELLVWRKEASQPLTLRAPLGRLSVYFDLRPAPEAIASRRQSDVLLSEVAEGGWSDLPGSRVEMERIVALFGAERASVFADAQASEQSLDALRERRELPKYRFLHFATHGELNSDRAFESALILSQDALSPNARPQAGAPLLDGQVSAREVLEFWELDAELVTLSACETALGRGGGGDGMLGFAQAFLLAGSRAVCLSLWKVDDAATALLMVRFYENLLARRTGLAAPMPKAEALAEAKHWLRNLSHEEALQLAEALAHGVSRGDRAKGVRLNVKKPEKGEEEKPFAHPRYWSAFVLIGDPR
jgi:CHAT domain-containing protein